METKRGDHKKLCTPTNNADVPTQGMILSKTEQNWIFKGKSQLLTYRALVLIPVLRERAQCQAGGIWQCFVLSVPAEIQS